MLVLTRKVGETILVGDSVEIVITEIKGSHVRIGICAPRELTVLRSELNERLRIQGPISEEEAQRMADSLTRKKRR